MKLGINLLFFQVVREPTYTFRVSNFMLQNSSEAEVIARGADHFMYCLHCPLYDTATLTEAS